MERGLLNSPGPAPRTPMTFTRLKNWLSTGASFDGVGEQPASKPISVKTPHNRGIIRLGPHLATPGSGQMGKGASSPPWEAPWEGLGVGLSERSHGEAANRIPPRLARFFRRALAARNNTSGATAIKSKIKQSALTCGLWP